MHLTNVAEILFQASHANLVVWHPKPQPLSARLDCDKCKLLVIRQLFSIPKHLFQFRNVIPTREIHTQKGLGTVQTRVSIVELF